MRTAAAMWQDLIYGKAVRTAAGEPDLFAAAQVPNRRISSPGGRQHLEAYGGKEDAIDWVMDCVEFYSVTASQAPYYFAREGARLSIEPNDLEAEGSAPADLANLFSRPNPFVDYTELLELAVIDLLLAGEFLWLKYKLDPDTQKPLALYRMSPALIDVEPGAGFIKQYIYHPPGGDEMTIPADQVLHVKRPNPHNPYRGLGVIAGGPRVYDLELALTESSANFYEQGTKLSGVLQSERAIPPNVFKKIQRQFLQMYSGKRNAYKVAMLERGLKFQSIASNAAEAQFRQQGEFSRDRIAAAFRVPPPLLGDVSGVDRQAVREAQRIFDNKTLRPFLNRMQSQISFGLTQPGWGVDYIINHEYIAPIEDRIDLAEQMAVIPGIRVRELRAQMDLPPLGDERDELVLNLPGAPREEGGHPDQPIGSEAGRPANPENVKPFPAPGRPMPASAQAEKALSEAMVKLGQDLRGMLNGQ